MANEFVSRNGIIAKNNVVISGSLAVTGSGITLNGVSVILANQTSSLTSLSSSFASTASYVLNAVSSSYAINATGSFVRGGNSFGVAAVIGTNDTQNLTLETNGSGRLFISSSGNYIGAYRTDRFGNLEPTTQILEVDGIVRALYQSGASGSFETYGNGNTPVLFTARSDNSQPGILTFNGWGDYAFNKSLLIGYTPQSAGYGTGNLYVSNGIGIAKSSSNAALDVNGNAIITGSITSTVGFTGSLFGTASNASTASFANNFTVAGTLTAQTINVQTITSSIEFNTGSTRNGSTTANTHQFTGSVSITGSLAIPSVPVGTTETNILVADAGGNIRYRSNLSLQGARTPCNHRSDPRGFVYRTGIRWSRVGRRSSVAR